MKQDPTSAFLYTAIAENKLKIGQVQEALEYIDKAIKLDPSLREPYVMAGISDGLIRQGCRSGRLLCAQPLKLDPSKEDAYLHLAVLPDPAVRV